MRNKVTSLAVSDEMRGDFYNALTAAENVCFIGDSLTEGTCNGGVPWYEPIEHLIRGKIFNVSQGGATTKILFGRLNEMIQSGADLFVIAIGTNDVRYRKADICSMTPEEYIACLQILCSEILKKLPAAKFVFIAPWTSTDGDKISALPYHAKIQLNNRYTEILKNWCAGTCCIFINPNPRIKSVLNLRPHRDYLTDWIHPNATNGVALYSEAVMKF